MAAPPPPEGWTQRLLDQLQFHWTIHVRPRLDGLTDEEYFWEPGPGWWSLRRRGQETTEFAGGSGDWVFEAAYPEPDPAPPTTIAWRMAHLIVAVLGERNASHFGGPPTDFFSHEHAGSASRALQDLDDAIGRWFVGVAELSDESLDRPVGSAEGPFADHPMAGLVLHINREVIHHSAEILLLRDLRAAGIG